jgi:hypothetical protein
MALDYSKLTDEQLQAIADKNYSKLPDDILSHLADEHDATQTPVEAAPVTLSPEVLASRNDPINAAATGAIAGGAALGAKKSYNIAQALNNLGKGQPAPAAPPPPEPYVAPGQKWSSKTGFGAGEGETVREVDAEYKRIQAEKNKAAGSGKISSRLTGGSPDEILARARQEEAEIAKQARIRAQEKLALAAKNKAAAEIAAQQKLAHEAEQRFRVPNKVGKMLPVAGATAAYNIQDAINQDNLAQKGIATAGAVGSAAPFINKLPPKLRALGVGASLLAPVVNRGIDAIQEHAAGGAIEHFQKGGLELAKKMFTPVATKIVKASEALGAHEGKKLGLTQTDNFGVHGGRMGGNRFPNFQNINPLHQKDQVVWMNDSQKHADDMINRGGDNIIWSTYIGGPDQLKSNKTVFNDILKQHYARDLTPEQIELINKRIATLRPSPDKPLVFPQSFDIRDKYATQELGGDTFSRRSALASMLGEGEGVGKTKSGIALPQYQDILRSHRDPLTEGVPTSSVGTRLFTVDPNTPSKFSQEYHPDYNWTVHGKDQGVQFENPVPQNLAVPDWHGAYKERFPNREPHGNAWFNYMKNPQTITEEMLTKMQKEGYSKGGKILDLAKDFVLPAAENAARTQIIGTLPTYAKAAEALAQHGAKGRALDFGAGLGEGAKALGKNTDTYEPFAKNWNPTFTKPEDIPTDAYGRLTNLNVMNVVPREARDEMAQHIGRVMEPGGAGIVTTRGADVMKAQGRPGPEPMSIITSRDTYQKGFTKQELEDYMRYMLGKKFDVNKFNLGPAGVMIQKKAPGGAVKGGLETLAKKLMPLAEREANKAKFLNPSAIKNVMYHGTATDISQFRPKQANATFLTDSPNFAGGFADASENYLKQQLQNSLSNEELIKLNAKAAKLAKKTGESHIDLYHQMLKERLPTGQNVMPVHVQATNPFDYENPEHLAAIADPTLTPHSYAGINPNSLKHGDWEYLENPIVQRAIKKLGHDSFYVKEGGYKNLGVYDPNKIKSAIGNEGTYDINVPDITKKSGGSI